MNKLFLKGCNLVNYRTYHNIKNSLLVTGLGVGLSNLALSLSGIDMNMGYLSSLFYLSYVFLSYSNGEQHTKDVNELRNLYNEFIKNYNRLNKDFSFNEPISIYAMFSFLINNGYLSLDKKFNMCSDNCYNLYGILGSDIFAGNGVCRHTASMLTDILNDMDIRSMNLICYVPNNKFEFYSVDEKDYSRDKNMEFVSKHTDSLEEMKLLLERFKFLEENGIYLSVRYIPLSLRDKKLARVGNHVITYSLYQDKSYYLDPTSFLTFRMDDFKAGRLLDFKGREIYIKNHQLYRMNELEDREIREFLSDMEKYPEGISFLDTDKIVTSTTDICEENMDIFDKFYNDNCELYGEIVNKLVKIKKKRN